MSVYLPGEISDPQNRTSAFIHNALGQIERVVDALGGETHYSYHPFGELHTVKNDALNETEILYDARGFKRENRDRGVSSLRTF